MDDGTPKLRVLIRAPVQQIPCEPNQRAWKLWDLFCETVYRRDARYAGDESCPEFGTEELHLLSNYDSENDVKAWFMTDVGVKKERRSVDAGTVPLEVYRAAYDTTNERWYEHVNPQVPC